MRAIPYNCPYKGLQPYTQEDREYFFGRERDIKVVASNLIAAPLTILYGTSGVGKSSVLLAGVVPHLKEMPLAGIARPVVVVFRTWQGPAFLPALKADVLESVRKAARPEAKAEKEPADVNLPFDDFLLECSRSINSRLLLIFDQFEEYFLNPASFEAVKQFDAEFARSVNRREIDAHFLISMREDGLSKLDRLQGRIPNLLNNTLRVGHLDTKAARDAIRKPLDVYNKKLELTGEAIIRIEDTLVEALLLKAQPDKDNLKKSAHIPAGEPDQPSDEERIETPVLQILLTRVWGEEMRVGSRWLRLSTFNEQMGGAEKILNAYVKEVMARLSSQECDLAARILQFLVTPSGAKIAQQPKSLAAWAEVEGPEGEKRVEDLLKRLSSYEPESKQDLRLVRKINVTGQSDSYEIFHDTLARSIDEWRADYMEEKRQAEARSRARKLWVVISIISAIAVGVAALAIYAFRLKTKAQGSESLIALQRDEIAIKRNEAERMIQVVNELDRAMPFSKAVLRGHLGEVIAARFSPEGTLVVTVSKDGGAQLWRVEDNKSVQSIRDSSMPITNAIFHQDGKRIFFTTASGVSLYYLNQGFIPSFNVKTAINYAAFSPDDKFILTAGDDNLAYLWNADTGTLAHELRGHTGAVTSASFSPDGRFVVTASADATARVWDVTTGALVLVLAGHTKEVNSAVFSHSSSKVVTTSADNTAMLWDSKQGRRVQELRKHTDSVNSAVFSPDDKLIVTASNDKTAIIWDTKTGNSTPLIGHTDSVNEAIFSRNGVWVITASQDKTVRVWQATATKDKQTLGKSLAVLRGHAGSVTSIDTSGEMIVTASEDNTARIWDLHGLGTFRVTEAVLEANPPDFTGQCPVTIRFSGKISVAGSAGTVKYRFRRSDGVVSKERTLSFDSPGSKDVSGTWKVGSSTPDGWMSIEILNPVKSESNPANFNVECGPAPPPEPSCYQLATGFEPKGLFPDFRQTKGFVAGNIQNESGKGMGGTRLILIDNLNLNRHSGATGADGSFRFSNLIPSIYSLRIIKSGCVPCTINNIFPNYTEGYTLGPIIYRCR